MIPPTITPALIAALAEAAGLELPVDRREDLVVHLEAVWNDLGRLRDVDVDRYEPAFLFPPGVSPTGVRVIRPDRGETSTG